MIRKHNKTFALCLKAGALLVSLSSGYGRAFAGSCTGAGGTYLCGGAVSGGDLTQTMTINIAPPLTVTTSPFFGIDTRITGGDAFNLFSQSGLTFTDSNASTIIGGEDGIVAVNYGNNGLSITTTGLVTGTSGIGIWTDNRVSGTALTISAASVTGGDDGINANNSGTGHLSITATGPVEGKTDTGILAYNSDAGTDLTVTAANVTGGTHGIVATNNGNAGLSIATSDTVTAGPSGIGIWANNSANGTDLTINAAEVRGGDKGIFAINSGTGDLRIDTSGTVTATGNGDLAMGIYADNRGNGSLTITATDTVASLGSGAYAIGIYARNAANSTDLTITAAEARGGYAGIFANNQGSGALSISAGGQVDGSRVFGIFAANSGTDLSITAAQNVTGGVTGIFAENSGSGALSMSSSGTVTGDSGRGIWARNYGTDLTIATANVSGATDGILAFNSGSGALSISSSGTVTGDSYSGIWAENYNAGTDLSLETANVTGGVYGILAFNFGSGALSISSSGTVTGNSLSGISARNVHNGTDLTISTANVSGATDGILAFNFGSGALSISSSGAVTGTSGRGVWAVNYGTDLTIATANVSGATDGIFAVNSGSGALSISSSGTVIGTSGYGIWANNGGGQPTTINVGALSRVQGFDAGILVQSTTGQPATMNINGQVLNLTGLTTDDAIISRDGSTTINLFSGSAITGSISLGNFNDSVTLAGTLNGSVTMLGGNDTFIQVGGSTLTGIADGGSGNDTLGFNNMGTVDNGLLGTKYFNFENLGIYGGSTTLTGTWDFSVGSATIYQGTLNVNGTLSSGSLDIRAGGAANINGTATIAGNTMVAGLLNANSGGLLNTGSLDILSTGTANIFGTATVNEDTTVDGLVAVQSGGRFTTNTLTVTSYGTASVEGTARVYGTTDIFGHLDIGGTLATDTLTVHSGGTAEIDGTVAVHGATDIFGRLYLDGNLSTSQLTVDRGGFLGGNGSIIGDVTVFGTISPGHSIGTLNVDGSLSFMPGSTYLAELTAGGNSDLIRVNGPVMISGGTIATDLPIALYANGYNWHIITASGGISGSFSTIDSNFTSYTINLAQRIQDNSLDLVIDRTPYASFGATKNQASVGSALDQLLPLAHGTMANLLLNMDFAMNPDQLTATLKGLNPDMYTAFPATGLEVAGIFSRMVTMRQQEVAVAATDKEQLWDVWGQVLGHRLDRDTEDGISGYTLDSEGTVFGMDRALGQATRVGLIFGYSSSDVSFDDSGDSGEIDGKHIGFYGGTQLAGFAVNGTAGFTSLDNGASRAIATPIFALKTASSFKSNVFAGNLQSGYDFSFGNIRVGPTAALDYQYLDQQGFSEKGGEDFAVRVKGSNAESLSASLGLRMTDVIESGNWRFLPRAEVDLVHRFFGDATTLTCNFADYPAASFTVDGSEPEANQALAILGMSAEYNKKLSLYLNFSAAIGEQQNSQLLAGGLTWAF